MRDELAASRRARRRRQQRAAADAQAQRRAVRSSARAGSRRRRAKVEIEERRHADERQQHADRKLGRRDDAPADRIGEHAERRTDGTRTPAAETRASDPTRRRATCGTISPMKPTIPARTTLLAAEQRGRREDHPLRAIDVDADRARAHVADAQRVERRDGAERSSTPEPRRTARRRARSCQPRPAIDPASHATIVLGIIARLRAHDGERDDRGEQRREGNAGEDQAVRIDAAAAARERRDEQRGAEPGDETDRRA